LTRFTMSLVGLLTLISTLPACSPSVASGSPQTVAVGSAATMPAGMPPTWRKVAENREVPGGYRVDWRYEAPEGLHAGTGQQISFSPGGGDTALLSTATALLGALHHNVGFGAATIVDRQGKQAGFNYFGDDTGDLPPSPRSATRPIMGTVWFRQRDGRTEALDVFAQSGALNDAAPRGLSIDWLQ
jgi:hypothetical protein